MPSNFADLYYRLPCPWLQVKCLRFLQYYKIPEAAQFELLNDILSKILVRTEHSGVGQSAGSDSNNRSNAEHAILFEAINLILTFGLDAPTFLKEHTSAILGTCSIEWHQASQRSYVYLFIYVKS